MEQTTTLHKIATIGNLSDDELREGYDSVLDELLSEPYDKDLKATQKIMEFEIVRRWMRSLEVNIVGKRQ